MREITYRQALNEALAEELERDPNVFLMGEEVAEYNGAYKVSQGLLERFGPRRIIDTPISENGFAGLGVGAAMVGLRPIIEFMTFSFSLVAFDQVVNNAPNMFTMSGGQFNIPITFRGPNGPAHQLGATHSHATEPLYANAPGLKVCTPATPRDAKGLLKTAVRDKLAEIVASIRKDAHPAFVEARTYRYRGHSMSDPASYRTKEELEKYRLDDPITRLRAQLTREGKVTNEQFDQLDKHAKKIALDSVKFAEESPDLPLERLYDYTYVNGKGP